MLDELHVTNVALIRDAIFTPSSGFSVITGETGTGKTALLSALKLLVGERADAAVVREGESQATVEGRFFCRANPDDEGIVAVRKVGADGRSRVSLNGSLATVGQLGEQVGATVDLCGQHEHQQLLRAANHVRLLDAWAHETVDAPKQSYEQAFRAAAQAALELERVKEASRATAAQVDEARFVLKRIDEVDPQEGEYEQIMADLPRIENAEELARVADGSYEALAGDDGLVYALSAIAGELESLAKTDGALAALAQTVSDASFALEDAAHDLRSYRDRLDRDPQTLAYLQQRASALQGLMRAFGPEMSDVAARREQAARLVASVDDADRLIGAAQRRVAECEAELARAAAALNDARKQAAPRFAEQVCAVMAQLEMGSARLVVECSDLERSQWSLTGPAKVEFLYCAAAGMTPRPLARIASGGEISRVMLACKVVLGACDERDTLVFDEVDAGVGGSVAVALAKVLAELSATHQVIVVTHLPQVAVRAQTHFVVRKVDGAAFDGAPAVPETVLSQVEGEARVREVARMLSGDVGEASLAHARELLAQR